MSIIDALIMQEITLDAWVELYGSDTLKNSLALGYSSQQRYLNERSAIDYPGFFYPDFTVEKTDSPPDYCLDACLSITGSYCSQRTYLSGDCYPYYVAIDGYLGEYTIIKQIEQPQIVKSMTVVHKIEQPQIFALTATEQFQPSMSIQMPPILEISSDPTEIKESTETDKSDWIIHCGSDLLKESYLGGYDSDNRYVSERAASEYPGFTYPGNGSYERVDSPPDYCLKACLAFEDAYCATPKHAWNSEEVYLAIDNYLGDRTIVKKIDPPVLQQKGIAENRKYCVFPCLCLISLPMVMIIGLVTLSTVANYTESLPVIIPSNTKVIYPTMPLK